MRINGVVGFQNFTSTVMTSAVTCSTSLYKSVTTGVLANAALFQAGGSSGAIRWRDDGAAPTSNIGMRLPTGTVPYFYQGDLTRIQFIADSVPGNAELQVTYLSVSD